MNIIWEIVDKNSLREAFKEFLRVVLADLVPTLIMVLGLVYTGFNMEIGTVDIRWSFIKITLIGSMIRLIIQAMTRAYDRYIHVNPNIKSGGFLPK